MKGYIHSIETLAAVDGPGVRTAIFLQGCPQRCIYCHNPDTWKGKGGQEMSVEELVEKILRYRPYYKETGGVTISGGEPFFQAEFVCELLKALKKEGIHTAVDTCGYYLDDIVKEALLYTDLVLLDVKHTDPQMYQKITKADFSRLIRFLDYMKQMQKPLWIRQVIVPGYTDSEAQVEALLELLKGANVQRIDLLAYHTLGVPKWKELGMKYELEGVQPPETEAMQRLNQIILKAYPNNKKIEKEQRKYDSKGRSCQ
jgi:pyruvate formate lyase activating enzyme